MLLGIATWPVRIGGVVVVVYLLLGAVAAFAVAATDWLICISETAFIVAGKS